MKEGIALFHAYRSDDVGFSGEITLNRSSTIQCSLLRLDVVTISAAAWVFILPASGLPPCHRDCPALVRVFGITNRTGSRRMNGLACRWRRVADEEGEGRHRHRDRLPMQRRWRKA